MATGRICAVWLIFKRLTSYSLTSATASLGSQNKLFTGHLSPMMLPTSLQYVSTFRVTGLLRQTNTDLTLVPHAYILVEPLTR